MNVIFFSGPYLGSDGKSICLQCVRPGVRSLGGEDPLEKEIATHFSALAWKIPWMEEPGYSPWGRKESDTTGQLYFHFQCNFDCSFVL